jgi:hypothetical protein
MNFPIGRAPASHAALVSARILRPGYAGLLADRDHDAGSDFSVPRDDRPSAGRTAPLRMPGTFFDGFSAVLAQVALQGAALHDAKGSSSSSRSGSAGWSGSGLSMSLSASITFSRASGRVRPWLIAPGTSSTCAMIQPSPPSE